MEIGIKSIIYLIGAWILLIASCVKYSDAMLVGALILFVMSFAENKTLNKSSGKRG